MASLIFFLLPLLLLLSCFSHLCLSYTFVDDNPIRLKSQGLPYADDGDDDDDDDPSLANIIMRPPIEAIYSFGDSISDTGNVARYTSCGKYPYGISYFDKPTGRCSDGLLIIDYIARFAGLPFLDAYLNRHGNFRQGVNFAVIAATALNVTYLREKYHLYAGTDFDLSVQLSWFKSYLNSTYPNASDRRTRLSNSLIVMGEIGGNDYNLAFSWKRLPEIYRMVPDVVQQIKSATEEVIDLGATRIAIPGNFPVGCMTCILARFRTSDKSKYDELKCLKYLNDFAKYHNEKLKLAITDLQIRHPDVSIVYMDLFGSMRDVLRNADLLGYDTNALYKACCGFGDNKYNYGRLSCDQVGVPYCEEPWKRISWDGIHLTQRTYQLMANRLLSNAPYDASNSDVSYFK